MWLVSQRVKINHWLLAVPWICRVFSHLPPSLMLLCLQVPFPLSLADQNPRTSSGWQILPPLCRVCVSAECCLHFRRVLTEPVWWRVCLCREPEPFLSYSLFLACLVRDRIKMPPRGESIVAGTSSSSGDPVWCPAPTQYLLRGVYSHVPFPSPIPIICQSHEGREAIRPRRPWDSTSIVDSIPGSSSDFVSQLNEKRLWNK